MTSLTPRSVLRVSERSLPKIGVTQDRLEVIGGTVPDPLAFPKGCKFHPRCPIGCDDGRCKSVEPQLREVKPSRLAACSPSAGPVVHSGSRSRAVSQTFGAWTRRLDCFQNCISDISRLYQPLPTMPCSLGDFPVSMEDWTVVVTAGKVGSICCKRPDFIKAFRRGV